MSATEIDRITIYLSDGEIIDLMDPNEESLQEVQMVISRDVQESGHSDGDGDAWRRPWVVMHPLAQNIQVIAKATFRKATFSGSLHYKIIEAMDPGQDPDEVHALFEYAKNNLSARQKLKLLQLLA